MQIEIIYLATSVEENDLYPIKYIKKDGHPKHERMEIIRKIDLHSQDQLRSYRAYNAYGTKKTLGDKYCF